VFRSCHRDWQNGGKYLTSFLFPGSRYIYDLYYEKEAISKQLYDWLLKNNYADANLIAKWKKQGYEKVCLQFLTRYGTAADCTLAVLPALRSNQRDQLQRYVYMPRAQGAAQGGPDHSMCQLRLPRMCKYGLESGWWRWAVFLSDFLVFIRASSGQIGYPSFPSKILQFRQVES
jgi:hypothetical protein